MANKQISKMIGNAIAAKMPTFKFPPAAPDTNPTTVGPEEQPRSPASAKSANIAVPPRGRRLDALLNVPGHIMPTEKPQSAQPRMLKIGSDDKAVNR